MNKIFLLILIVSFSYTCAENWEDHWIKALKAPSEEEFNLAVKLLEEKKLEDSHPYVYLDRGNFYLNQNKYNEAVEDFNKLLNSKEVSRTDKISGLLGRMTAYSYLNQEDKAMKDCVECRKFHNDFPKTEFLKDKIIIRNMSEDVKSMGINILKAAKFCKDESEIEMLCENTWVIRK